VYRSSRSVAIAYREDARRKGKEREGRKGGGRSIAKRGKRQCLSLPVKHIKKTESRRGGKTRVSLKTKGKKKACDNLSLKKENSDTKVGKGGKK